MVSADGSWDVRPFEAWIVDEYLPSLSVGPRPGEYARRPGETETALYGAADVACILYSLDRLDPSPDSAAEWLEVLSGFQDPVSGFFVDRSGSLSTAHNTGFAVGAMNLLHRELSNGELPKSPLRFARLVREPADAERFAGSLDWRNDCYEAGENLIGHASSFFNVSGAMPAGWFEWLVDYVERTKMDEANGMVGIDKPPGGDTDQIGGTLHFDFFWAALGRQLPFASARTEALLGLQLPSGLWDPNNPWWLTFDAVYMLRRTLPDLSADRAESVRAAVARAASALTARSSDPELRRSDFVDPWIGAHMVTGAVSFFAYAQQVLGESRVITDRPLRSVLDRRPYI
jgi:hypothetical protein